METKKEQKEKSKDNIPGIKPDNKNNSSDVPRGSALRSTLANISSNIEKLEHAISSLPHVDPKGSSECPFAQDLYAQKEELEKQVESDIRLLKRYSNYFENEIKRCRKNLQQIDVDNTKLNLQETSECYSDAIEAQQQELRSAIQDKDALSIVLSRAEAVLKVSKTRKYPGQKPQRQQPVPVKPSETSPDSQAPIELSGELGGLLSLGPMDQNQSK